MTSGRAKNVASYKNEVNAGELNKWICLSVHCHVDGGTMLYPFILMARN